MSTANQGSNDIRPFHVDNPEEKVDDLRRRIAATRWPSKELVTERVMPISRADLTCPHACRPRPIRSANPIETE